MTSLKSQFLRVLQERGFIHQHSNLEGLDAKLMEGTQSAYIGFDATAKSLHVGNLLGIMMLYWFQQSGHKPITLMGGGTTRIGDPSGKTESRKLQTDETIAENIAGIKQAFGKFLKYGDGPNDALMVNNDDWLRDLNCIDFLRDVGSQFTVNRMLSFEFVKSRIEKEESLSFLEFNYMIFQAYDFVELSRRYGTLLQMGGSDQWGNIINGVDLGHKMDRRELFALTCPLLTTASGAKMGKSAAGAVWLNAEMLSPYDYYQFWRNTEDGDVVRFLKLYTTLPMAEIEKLAALKDKEINDAKKILAFEATKLCHGEDAARDAADTAQKVFEQGGVGGDLPVINIPQDILDKGITLIDLLIKAEMVQSKGEARRLIEQKGARVNDNVIADTTHQVSSQDLTADGHIKLSSGKKHHALIKLEI